MENLPSASSPKTPPLSSSVEGEKGGCDAVVQAASNIDMSSAEQLVLKLSNSELRGDALQELSKNREMLKDLGPLLWYSFGTVITLIQEVITIYPALSPPALSASAANRVCNALALFQSIASHSETRAPFIKADLPQYLYPFLDTANKAKPFEYLRLTSLGVVGALVKEDDTEAEVINFLLRSQVIPLCLQNMEQGSELAQTVCTFILLKILLDDVGLQHVCATPERFFAVASALTTMLNSMGDKPCTRLLKHVIRCYLRLSDNPRGRIALQINLPEVLKDGTFDDCLKDDSLGRKWLQQLLDCLSAGSAGGAAHPSPGHAAGGSRGGASEAGPSHSPGI